MREETREEWVREGALFLQFLRRTIRCGFWADRKLELKKRVCSGVERGEAGKSKDPIEIKLDGALYCRPRNFPLPPPYSGVIKIGLPELITSVQYSVQYRGGIHSLEKNFTKLLLTLGRR